MHTDLERSELLAERLRALPGEASPPMTWAEFQPRLTSRRGKAGQTWRYTALAAGVAALVTGLALWSRVTPSISTFELATGMQSELPALAALDPQAIKQAEASERWLAYLPAEPAVVRVGTRSAVADLEDRIAMVDDVLSEEVFEAVNPNQIVALRHERARLVNSLAQVRYAETLVAGAQ